MAYHYFHVEKLGLFASMEPDTAAYLRYAAAMGRKAIEQTEKKHRGTFYRCRPLVLVGVLDHSIAALDRTDVVVFKGQCYEAGKYQGHDCLLKAKRLKDLSPLVRKLQEFTLQRDLVIAVRTKDEHMAIYVDGLAAHFMPHRLAIDLMAKLNSDLPLPGPLVPWHQDFERPRYIEVRFREDRPPNGESSTEESVDCCLPRPG